MKARNILFLILASLLLCTAVSVQEDLSYQSIIDRADRTVEDGKPVMEYVE